MLRLLAAFCPADDGWRTVRAVCEALPALAAQVDVRALVTAALLNGLLRAVDVVPVVPRQMRRDSAGGGALGGGRLARLVDGRTPIAALACELNLRPADVERRLLAEVDGCALVQR